MFSTTSSAVKAAVTVPLRVRNAVEMAERRILGGWFFSWIWYSFIGVQDHLPGDGILLFDCVRHEQESSFLHTIVAP